MDAWPADPTRAKLVLDLVCSVAALIVFFIGLHQYEHAQRWKSQEFLVAEVKSLLADPLVRIALLLIDWSTRPMPFDPATPRATWPRVNREAQIRALEPHELRPLTAAMEEGKEQRFADDEAKIRDAYDALLDGLDRLEAVARAGLFRHEELRPFVDYWLESMAKVEGSDADRRWRLALLAYIEHYRFTGTQRLLRGMGIDPAVGGAVWVKLQQSSEEARALAARLQGAIRQG